MGASDEFLPPPVSTRNILIAVNGSDSSDAALLFALRHVASDHDKLFIVHVRPTDKELASLYSGCADAAAEVRGHHDYVRHTMSDATKAVHSAGLSARVMLEEGDPRKVVPRIVEAEGIDLLVLGSQGKRTLHRMIAGDLATFCAKRCLCAVITFKSTNGGVPSFNKRAEQDQERLGIASLLAAQGTTQAVTSEAA